MAYYDAMIARWSALTGSTEDKLAAINALTVPGPLVDVQVSLIEGSLSLAGSLTAVEDWLATSPPDGEARTAAKELMRTVASPHVNAFQMSSPEIAMAVTGLLTALSTTMPPLLSTDQVTALLSLAQTTTPWWQASLADGGAGLSSPVGPNDLVAAGGLT